jgi:hypothetical protein
MPNNSSGLAIRVLIRTGGATVSPTPILIVIVST